MPEDALTGSRFENLTLVDAEYLDVSSMGSFRFNSKNEGFGFAHPATAKAGSGSEPLVFTVTGKIVSLIIRSGTAVRLSVDGGDEVVVGSGSYFADAVPVVISDEATTHTFTVTPFLDDADAVILAAAYK